MTKVLSILVLTVIMAGSSAPAYARQPMPEKDRELIKTLLDRLKQREDLTFIRLDKKYDAKAAAWYLKYKWDHNKDKVHSIQDFINLESYGGDHGEVTYYVEFSDGRKITAKEMLEQSIQDLEREQKQ